MNVLIILAVVALLIVLILHETKSIVITRYDVDGGENLALPIRILQVSDVQSRYFGKEQCNLIRKCQETKPDIIVITGDLIDRNYTDYKAASIVVEKLSELAPVFYVNGNHETALNKCKYDDFLKKEAEFMEILFDRSVSIECKGATFNLGGLSEDTINKSRGYDRRCRNLDEDILVNTMNNIFANCPKGPKILLAHEPQLINIYEKGGCNIVLTGHAHGGQFRIPFTKQGLYAPEQGVLPKYTEGIHECGKGKMVISRGLGNSRFPFRLFNRPELVVVDFK